MKKKLYLLANFICLFGLLAVASLNTLWPEHLASLGLRGDAGKVVMLQLISLMFLLGAFQSSLSASWRRFSLAASFTVLGQSILVGILIPGL